MNGYMYAQEDILYTPQAKHELPLSTTRSPHDPPPPNYKKLEKIDASIIAGFWCLFYF